MRFAKPKTRRERRARRHRRLRNKVAGTAERPRLAVFRSLRHTYVQLVDDDRAATIAAASDLQEGCEVAGSGKVKTAFEVGKLVAQRAKALGIEQVIFDRGGYPYHGRVKAVAEGAREGGLEF